MIIHLTHKNILSPTKTRDGWMVHWVGHEDMFDMTDTFCGDQTEEWKCIHIDTIKLMPEIMESGQLCQECLYSEEAGLALLADL